MKNLHVLSFTLILSLLFTSCSNSDDGSDNEPEIGNYFPLVVDNYWNYDVEKVDNLDSANSALVSDFLFVDSQVGTTYNLGVNTNNLANGFMNGIFVNGLLVRGESTLKIDGILQLPLEGFGDFGIDFTNVILYDLNASYDEEMSSITGNFTEELEGIPITVAFELTTTSKGNSNSLSVNGETYSNITKSNLSVKLNITTIIEVIDNPISFTILEEQDVISIDNYFAENIGLIKSEADITYELDTTTLALLEAANIVIEVPITIDIENNQNLRDYSVIR